MYKGYFKIDAAKRQELVELYLKDGMKAVAAKAKQYGVTPKYVANVACNMGMKRQARGISVKTAHDPRWERARTVGEVVL